ncbi:chlorophyll synthase ChlG [Methylorubrum rhodesianum]|uniref:chlorophyll synthase ChlG n=1 Tax=Methylorubrum TaxID=2282523 RepID=UPI0016209654|nr:MULTISPECIES: chlorophyll synthase ChlG [Methylorubrum]MBB5764321.1 chlorophyll synthase [Methylorubrum rhodesianum]MBI1689985.1 chlorophyll synthase ChlG [Methylorubrum sp. DB1722]
MATPAPSAVVELLKPITWFAPMWAFGCGVISSGQAPSGQWFVIAAGVVLAGPLVCATSQAANDWFDRHVDAINEPNRPIPSGRIPGRWGLYLAAGWTILSLVVAAMLGPWILGAALFGLVLAWIYSAPPLRLKRNGWWGNSAVALCYEGLPWFTGAAVMAASMPDRHVLLVALLYSVGAHGIMTLNDFKSVEGDRAMGLRSLPVQLGSDRAARFACLVMALPQVVVVALLFHWERTWHAGLVAALLAGQLALMLHFLKAPRSRAAWYNGTGTTLYVLGMLASAFALRPLVQGLAP